jgi:hypothetical protein
MTKIKIKKTVFEIIDTLCGRNGFDNWWYNLDDEIQEKITKEIEEIIKRRLIKN